MAEYIYIDTGTGQTKVDLEEISFKYQGVPGIADMYAAALANDAGSSTSIIKDHTFWNQAMSVIRDKHPKPNPDDYEGWWDLFITTIDQVMHETGTPTHHGQAKIDFTNLFSGTLGTSDLVTLGLTTDDSEDNSIEKVLFIPSFGQFIQKYIADHSTDYTWGNFSTDLITYLTVVGVMTNATTSTTIDNSTPYANLLSYEKIWQSFFGINSAAFNKDLIDFFNNRDAANKEFRPTPELLLWFNALQVKYLASPESSRVISSPTDAEKTLILNDIFELIVSMIDAIERVTEAQADRLTFLTSYQKAYTDLMAQVPVYVKSETNTGVIYIEDKDNTTERNDLNQLSQGYLDNLRNYRDLVSDDSKTIQSAINQSNDEVSGVTDLANHIMDTLSSLLQAIYR